jgi:hypothetical protein
MSVLVTAPEAPRSEDALRPLASRWSRALFLQCALYVSSASMCSSALLQAAGQCLCLPAIVQHATSLLPLEEEFMGRTYMLAIRKLSYDHFFRCYPREED